MISLAKLSIRRPKAALIAWLLAGIALAAIGFGVSKTLSPSVTVVPDSQSARAQQLANAQFGPSQLVPILLEGPKAQLDKQGPKVVLALTGRPHTRVLSAWDAGTASAGLRPAATAAMIVASIDRPERDVVAYDQPQIESLVTRTTGGSVKAYITGQPSIDRALKDASLNGLRHTELIAVGVLFLLLLVGLRAPVAAAIVTAVGAVSMLAAFGDVALLGKVMRLDPVGVAAGTMTGLAFGVGFSLLILDRFHREEYPTGTPPRDVATAALRELYTTGRAVLLGGTALVVALGLVAVVGPTELMVSLGTGTLTCAAFATGGAVVVMPAAMVLLGRRIDAFSFPAPRLLTHIWGRVVEGGSWVTRHAVYTGFGATVLLAVIALPAFGLKTGEPSVTQLPAHAHTRVAFQEVSRVMGAGWATPFNVIVVARNRPITDPNLLASIDHFQKQIAKDQTVDSVTGPASINSTSTQLKKFWPGLQKSVKVSKTSKKDLLKLIDGLGQAGSGSKQLRSGLVQALSGANQLHGGSGQAKVGAAALHVGLAQAQAGSTQLSSGLNSALSGAQALKSGAVQALAGASQLTAGLTQASTPVKAGLPAISQMATAALSSLTQIKTLEGQAGGTSQSVQSAIAALSSMGAAARNDPGYSVALSALAKARDAASSLGGGLASADKSAGTAAFLAAGVKSQVTELSPGLVKLQSGAAQLAAGIGQLRNGNAQLAGGLSQLAGGGGQLKSGLGQLTSGAGQLEAGLVLLDNGTGQLAYGLTAAPGGAGQIATGLGQMQAAVVKARGQIPSTKDLETLHKQSPGLFSSGYFVLAAVGGAQASDRNAATFTINLLRGGTAGQILVVSKYASGDPRTDALRARLTSLGSSFAAKQKSEVAIGGPAGNLADLTSQTESKIWVDVAVLAAALALVLAIGLRSIVLPVVAIAFNLLVAGATFGVIQVLFGGSNPLLGGPGYLDPISIISIFTVAFGISVVYSALLLTHTREAYMRGEHGRQAVITGLRETAAAATGAGVVMIAAVLPFATSDLINIRQLGVGVATAILLDVMLFRPVLLPAAEAVFGRFGWWPTRRPGQSEPPAAKRTTRTLPRIHLPHRHPRAAHR